MSHICTGSGKRKLSVNVRVQCPGKGLRPLLAPRLQLGLGLHAVSLSKRKLFAFLFAGQRSRIWHSISFAAGLAFFSIGFQLYLLISFINFFFFFSFIINNNRVPAAVEIIAKKLYRYWFIFLNKLFSSQREKPETKEVSLNVEKSEMKFVVQLVS